MNLKLKVEGGGMGMVRDIIGVCVCVCVCVGVWGNPGMRGNFPEISEIQSACIKMSLRSSLIQPLNILNMLEYLKLPVFSLGPSLI